MVKERDEKRFYGPVTINGSYIDPELDFFYDRPTSDDDIIGYINFQAENSVAERITYSRIRGKAEDVTDGTEDGSILFDIMIAGTMTTVFSLGSDGDLKLTGSTSASVTLDTGANGRHLIRASNGDMFFEVDEDDEVTTNFFKFEANGNKVLDIDEDGNLDPNGDIYVTTKTPASAGATGTAGTIAWDADYIYVCVATDTWKRVAISTW